MTYKPPHPDLPPLCEVCHERLAVGPLTCICSPCYAELAPRIAAAPQFRVPLPSLVIGGARPRRDYTK
jgi:hypothetical protein